MFRIPEGVSRRVGKEYQQHDLYEHSRGLCRRDTRQPSTRISFDTPMVWHEMLLQLGSLEYSTDCMVTRLSVMKKIFWGAPWSSRNPLESHECWGVAIFSNGAVDPGLSIGLTAVCFSLQPRSLALDLTASRHQAIERLSLDGYPGQVLPFDCTVSWEHTDHKT